MAEKEEEFYIGMDVGSKWCQISYYTTGMQEPETVSMVAGEEWYRIPTALCKDKEFAPWHLVDLRTEPDKKADMVYIDNLLERSLNQEMLHLSEDYEAQELFCLFLRKIIRLLPGFLGFSKITAITFHLEHLEMKRVKLMQQMAEKMGIPKERVFIQDSKECFCHFALNQKKELTLHDIVLFLCQEDEVHCLYLEKEDKTRPQKVHIQKQMLGVLPKDPVERDMAFETMADEVTKGKIVSVVYLMGQGLEGGWLKESLNVLCRGRKAFQGKNLYTKGACYGSYMQMHKKECPYVYFSEYKLTNNIYIQVRSGEQKFFRDLAEAGSSCYEVNGSCQVLLSGDASVDIWLQPPESTQAKIESLQLTDLPNRPPKATRLKIEAFPGEKQQIMIRITDLGLGALYPSSGKVWEYCIDE